MKIILPVVLFFFAGNVVAQTSAIQGMLGSGGRPVCGARVTITNNDYSILTDSIGNFSFLDLPAGRYTLEARAEGFKEKWLSLDIQPGEIKRLTLELETDYTTFRTVLIKDQSQASALISGIDMELRPLSSSQELLPMVPGLFIAQHTGGGKAEQIFLRGFDADHGTDFAIFVDGMPVNMTSHAHGQGYADLHFLIPETVKELDVSKGPYATRYGDLATAGAGEFRTLKSLDKNVVKLEYGSFFSPRFLTMLDLLKGKKLFSAKKENLILAAEYRYSNSYFQSKQNFNRFNIFLKYAAELNNDDLLELTATGFSSKWNASGQIPERKVADGSISRYGSIDPSEGGRTSRFNLNLVHTKTLPKGSFKNQFYYSKYDFNLYSNFTFYLNDSINGDQINQVDDRNLMGYSGTLNISNKLAGKTLRSLLGIGFRYDNATINLDHTIKRNFLNSVVNGKLNQAVLFAFADEDYFISPRLKVNIGARLDVYHFMFDNHLNDSASGKEIKAVVSPKWNLFYTINNQLQMFVKSGFGFHSNDARAVVVGKFSNALPRAFGYEFGALAKPRKNTVFNAALWALDLESEFVYVGDEGVVEAAGRTRRYGVDIGVRQQFFKYWFLDVDVNICKGRLRDEPEGADRIPLAPAFTSTGGISYKKPIGFSGSLRYRYMGDRPAMEDNSLVADGFFLVDMVCQYTMEKLQFGIAVENLFNTEWKEAQFATESRLQQEVAPVNEIHYTPGTPFFVKGTVSVLF